MDNEISTNIHTTKYRRRGARERSDFNQIASKPVIYCFSLQHRDIKLYWKYYRTTKWYRIQLEGTRYACTQRQRERKGKLVMSVTSRQFENTICMNKQYIKENRPILQLNTFPIQLYEDICV